MRYALLLAAIALAAAPAMAKTGAKVPVPRTSGVETISYVTGPCFGTCPVYKVTVGSDGRGVFEGVRFTAVTGRRSFRATPAQWAEFRRRLASLHGHGTVDMTGPPMCKVMVTDLPSVELVWSGGQRPFRLRVSFGCDRDRHGAMFDQLRTAPEALPIAALIGRR